MRYVDSNIFIYAITNNEKYGGFCKKILLDIEDEKLKACASVLILVEIFNSLSKINKELKKDSKKTLDIKQNIDAILSYQITWFELEFLTIKKAAEYLYNIASTDYFHLATMELNSIKEIISADIELDKVEFIKRIDPLEY